MKFLVLMIATCSLTLGTAWAQQVQPQVLRCQDSDGRDSKRLGVVTIMNRLMRRPIQRLEDSCKNENVVKEYFCRNQNTADFFELNCQFGCENGACLNLREVELNSCPESDIEPYTNYIVLQPLATFQNSCFDIVETRNIVVNCKHNSLTGEDKNGQGIDVRRAKNITIKNCPIHGFYQGILATQSHNVKIQNVDLSENAVGLGSTAAYLTVQKAKIRNNDVVGVAVGVGTEQFAIDYEWAHGAQHFIFEDSLIRGNGGNGGFNISCNDFDREGEEFNDGFLLEFLRTDFEGRMDPNCNTPEAREHIIIEE